MSLNETILDLEHQTWRALQKDGASLIPFLSKDCIMMFPMGVRVSATSTPDLKQVLMSEAFVPWQTYEIRDPQIVHLSSDAAAITYSVTAMRPKIHAPDDGEPFIALVSTVWRRDHEGAGWLMVLHQQTPYAELDLAGEV
jgi:hypothetical protein